MNYRFERLLRLYKDQAASPEEQEEFFELIQSGAFDDLLGEDISNTLRETSPGLLHTEDPIKEEIFGRIIRVIRRSPGESSSVSRDPGRGEHGSNDDVPDPGISNKGKLGLSEGGSWMAIAASLVLAATSSLWLFNDAQQQHYTDEKHSGKGIFILPDGTKVTLSDAKSALIYFTEGNSRVVKLRGEASFEIEWDHRPFYVQTGKIRTRVIGTAFNVRTYTVEAEVPLKPPITIDPSDQINNPQTIL